MATIISGSVAYDTIFDFSDRFADSLRSEALEHLNLTFEASSMRKAFGGCAANIACSLKALGGEPIVWTAAGKDIGMYLEFFRQRGIRTDGIAIHEDEWSAQCVITTDKAGCQLTTFLCGAMERAGDAPFPDDPNIDMAILAPSTRKPMLLHAKAFAERRIPFILDLGQTTPQYSGEEYLDLLDLAFATAVSDYEADLVREMTGLDTRALSLRGKTVFQTHGAAGSTVWIDGEDCFIETPRIDRAINPVGAGDYYRGGLLWGLTHGLDALASARLGAVMGAARAANIDIDRKKAKAAYENRWGNAPF